MSNPPAMLTRIARATLAATSGVLLLAHAAWSAEAPIDAFFGAYSGSAKVERADGTTQDRDLSVAISETKDGFAVDWTTVTIRSDGRTTEKSYRIEFRPSAQDGLYSAAMKSDLFGNAVPLDPMKGEPYVWSQLTGDTLTVYALFVDATGGYEIQQFDRTLAEGGLDLHFTSIRNGETQRTVTTFLEAE